MVTGALQRASSRNVDASLCASAYATASHAAAAVPLPWCLYAGYAEVAGEGRLDCARHAAGDVPNCRLNARLNAASEL